MQTFLFIFSWLLFGVVTAYFAKQRGRNPYTWFLVGTFFGILGLITVFILPSLVADGDDPDSESADLEKSEPMIQLPHHDYAIKDWFYYDNQKQRSGPISYDDLKQRFKDNIIDPESFLWSEGMTEWKQLKDIPDLLEHFDR